MKKGISLLLALILCLSLCACVGGTMGSETDLVIYDRDGNPYINKARFPEIIEVVELTKENWRDYIKVYTYTYQEEEVVKDDSGAIISTETVTKTECLLGAGPERYRQFKDVSIELKNKATGLYMIFDFYAMGFIKGVRELPFTEDFNLDNYECTEIQGYLYYVNLPEEAIRHSENGMYFCIGEYEGSALKAWGQTFAISPETKEIGGNWHITQVLED